jgi:mannose-6-phosphate isomerase-like protein (cupin superfamily)
MQVGYVRMYHDTEGESHFEDLTLELEERDFAPPAAPAHVAVFLETSGTLFFGVRPGWAGETPHPSPQRQLFSILRGTVEVTVSNGERRRFRPGDLVFIDDTEGKGHSSHVVGRDELVIFGAVLADQRAHSGPS